MQLFSKEFRESLVVRALFGMLIITVTTFFLHKFFFKQSPTNLEILKEYYVASANNPKEIFSFVVTTPMIEEITYRWPVLGVFLLFSFVVKNISNKKIGKALIWSASGITLLVLNYLWAFGGHYYPITTFGFGIVWGIIMLYMVARKRYLASFLISFLFHAGSNAFALIMIILGYHIIL